VAFTLAIHQAQTAGYRKDLNILIYLPSDYGAYVNEDRMEFKMRGLDHYCIDRLQSVETDELTLPNKPMPF